MSHLLSHDSASHPLALANIQLHDINYRTVGGNFLRPGGEDRDAPDVGPCTGWRGVRSGPGATDLEAKLHLFSFAATRNETSQGLGNADVAAAEHYALLIVAVRRRARRQHGRVPSGWWSLKGLGTQLMRCSVGLRCLVIWTPFGHGLYGEDGRQCALCDTLSKTVWQFLGCLAGCCCADVFSDAALVMECIREADRVFHACQPAIHDSCGMSTPNKFLTINAKSLLTCAFFTSNGV